MSENTRVPEVVQQLAEMVGGKITESARLPDGSGFAMLSMSLPKTHWIYGDGNFNVPPMPFRMGSGWKASVLVQSPESIRAFGMEQRTGMSREDFAERIRDAGRYAVKCATMNGTENDFDPDALIQNLVVGMLGYWTKDGLSLGDDWANPKDGGGANWKAGQNQAQTQATQQGAPAGEPAAGKSE